MNKLTNENWFQRVKCTRGYTVLGTFVKSAAVGLLFAIVCFVFDRVNDAEQNEKLHASIIQLDKIQKSLSTRSLGIFPGYIKEIRGLFNDINKHDTIVIMEDVLYYGFKSMPKEFYEMNKKLFDHAMQDGSVTIAFYDFYQKNVPVAMDIFHNMIKNEHISPDNIAKMNKDCDSIIKSFINKTEGNKLKEIREIEYKLCEKYFGSHLSKGI